MTPAQIAKYRLSAQKRSSKEIAEKLVSRYLSKLSILQAKQNRTIEEEREKQDIQATVLAIVAIH